MTDAPAATLSSATLSSGERDLLRRMAAVMLPASSTYGVPGADDPLIQEDLIGSLGRDFAHVRAALALFAQRDGETFEAAVMRLLALDRAEVVTLGRVVLGCYYRDDRVLRSVEMEARAPYPLGHAVEQGDWSLLDAVRGRPQMWRDSGGL
jgi:hypothetical protein